MAKALYDAAVSPYGVDLINCHATSTDVGDTSELNALKSLFGNQKFKDTEYFKNSIRNYQFEFNIEKDMDKDRLNKLIINCNKTHFGHLLGAAGSVESIFTILALKNNKIISNMNTDNPITDLFKFKYSEKEKELNYAMKNSFAFGGVNTSVLFKKI
jgi:3-oxoacyl-[acyl-carrier-protein] synthase II